MYQNDLVDILVQRWVGETDHLIPSSIDEICLEHPELREQVERRVLALVAESSLFSAPTVSMQDLSTGALEETADGFPPVPKESSPFPEKIGSYFVREEVARGGMGAVLLGYDADLDRTLAIKVALDSASNSAEIYRRFIEEARITGRLQHPGIPPVHQVGKLDDGSPYFAMKLIQGKTLATCLRERPNPNDDLPRFLNIFEDICQTIAFAHDESIIHRDLKPQNIMVGAFGEVQVMDWGLAKRLDSENDTNRNNLESRESTSDRLIARANTITQVGTVLGTPAYMSPEQAQGDGRRIDARSDIFSLGGILCEILTGRPAYNGKSVKEIYAQAIAANTNKIFEELDCCGADDALVALAKRCLEHDREDRPQSANDLVEAIQEQAIRDQERIRKAELARAKAEARASEEATRRVVEKQRSRLAITLSLAVAALVVLGAFATVYFVNQQQKETKRIIQLEENATAGINQADQLRRQKRYQESRVALEGTESDVREIQNPQITDKYEEQALLLKRLDEIEQLKLRRATLVDTGNMATERFRLDKEFMQFFISNGFLAEQETVKDSLARLGRSEIHDELLEALDYWASTTADLERLKKILGLAKGLDPDPVRDEIRDPELWANPKKLADKLNDVPIDRWTSSLAAAACLKSAFLHQVSQHQIRRVESGHATELLVQLVRRNPTDFWLTRLAGMSWKQQGDTKEAEGYFRSALALRPNEHTVRIGLSGMMSKNGKHQEAIECLRIGAEAEPQNWAIQNALGDILSAQGKHVEAIPYLEEAIRLQPNSSELLLDLARELDEVKRYDEVVPVCQRALEVCMPDTRSEAMVHSFLGLHYYHAKKDPRQAVIHAKKALSFFGKPDPELWFYGDTSRHVLSFAQIDLMDYRGAMETLRELTIAHPKEFKWFQQRGWVCKLAGAIEEAKSDLEKALELLPPGESSRRPQILAELKLMKQAVENQERFADIISGEREPDGNKERIPVIEVCFWTHRFVQCAELVFDAYDEDPNLHQGYESFLSYAAANAACGRGQDADQLTNEEKLDYLQTAREIMEGDLRDLQEIGPVEKIPLNLLMEMPEYLARKMDRPVWRDLQNRDFLSRWSEQEQAAWLKLWAGFDKFKSAVVNEKAKRQNNGPSANHN